MYIMVVIVQFVLPILNKSLQIRLQKVLCIHTLEINLDLFQNLDFLFNVRHADVGSEDVQNVWIRILKE